MKAAVYYGQQDIRIEEIPTPEISDEEILVQMKACGICGSDLMDWYLKPRVPLVLGHEPAGTVAKKGKKVEKFSIGDRVFVHHHVACLKCHYCLHGNYTLCKQFHETNIEPGGFAEYFKVPPANAQIDTLEIPEKISDEEATLIEPVACCIRAIKKCNLQTGDTIAVIGAGTTGLIHTVLSKIYGATRTIVSDLIDFRLRLAEQFGADVTVNPKSGDLAETVKAETDGRGVDVAVVTAPNLEAYRAGINICRKGGKLCVFAPTPPEKHLQISPEELFFSEVQIIPSYSTSHLETRTALQLLETGRINVKPLITHRFELRQTAQAFKTALETRESLKVIITN
ncbi:MAG TPA: zinc-dependent dehydrogenase [candidate division Zixibacteria bacterium]|nr:zinc-dependent dehydrogenase [candidate division Zixibacteria bacterium]